jgi:hypothetical protein
MRINRLTSVAIIAATSFGHARHRRSAGPGPRQALTAEIAALKRQLLLLRGGVIDSARQSPEA